MPDAINSHRSRRCWIIFGAVAPFGVVIDAAAQSDAAPAQVWIDLSEPVPAGAKDAAEAERRKLRVSAQQDVVAQRLRALGVAELGRIVHSRNAILARVPADKRPCVLAIPGVVRLRPTQTLHPPKPMP